MIIRKNKVKLPFLRFFRHAVSSFFAEGPVSCLSRASQTSNKKRLSNRYGRSSRLFCGDFVS